MIVLETERLSLRWLTTDDAACILRLVNEPAWLQFIGDRGVRTLADAQRYLVQGPIAMYALRGFGLFAVVRKSDGEFLGICGLLKRDTLEDVDLGFAFLEQFRGQGFAQESAAAITAHAHRAFSLRRLVAITAPENHRSVMLLGKLGFTFERLIRLTSTSPNSNLFAWSAVKAASETNPPDPGPRPG